ncbi:MAG TPA: prephenate dehydrogenase [Syntrophobacteria bacterium]|nr:prephenate dehydrogenase [Syntrophobacteria bacterium]
MGSWFAELLERQGFTVLRSDLGTALTPQAMTVQCDVVVVSVPIAETLKVIREIGPLLPESALLMDLTSVKKAPLEAMLAHSTAQVVGLHPLLGPEAGFNSGGRVVVCPGRGESGLAWITRVLQGSALTPLYLDAEEHDRMMGLIQGANHFSTLALALTVNRSGFEAHTLTQYATETFRERLERIRFMMEQPVELFGSLLMDNPAAVEFSEEYLEGARRLLEVCRSKDKQAFANLFTSLRETFAAGKECGEGRR